jgi:hypothetical protein
MSRGTKRLAKAAAALAASGVVEEAVRKAVADPGVRKKTAEVGAVVRAKAKVAGRAAGKRAAALAREAGKQVGKKLAGPRKVAGKKIRRLAKVVEG